MLFYVHIIPATTLKAENSEIRVMYFVSEMQ